MWKIIENHLKYKRLKWLLDWHQKMADSWVQVSINETLPIKEQNEERTIKYDMWIKHKTAIESIVKQIEIL